MKKADKQPKRPSKSGTPDKTPPASDVSPRAARGGDKESNEPLPRPLKGGTQPRTTAGRKPAQ